MPASKLSLQEREAVYDVLRRYVWCMDTGDIEGVIATFTSDGEVKDITGRRWDLAGRGARGFAEHWLLRPRDSASQHWVQFLQTEDLPPDAVRVTSYWLGTTWAADDSKFVNNLGRYTDTCVKVDGEWRIREKVIDAWNNETVQMIGKSS
ncbi:MAG TPA: nuclear transport factor 2 family protein [Dehalococcoidia bacterium]|nr:nuclear transport factor 2 family protein [Dehalococcoidia bacterium]